MYTRNIFCEKEHYLKFASQIKIDRENFFGFSPIFHDIHAYGFMF